MDVRIQRIVGLPKPEYYDSLYNSISKTLKEHDNPNYRFKIYFQDIFNVIDEDIVRIKINNILDSTYGVEIVHRAVKQGIGRGITLLTGSCMGSLALSERLFREPAISTIIMHKPVDRLPLIDVLVSEAPLFPKIDFPNLIKVANKDEYLHTNELGETRHSKNVSRKKPKRRKPAKSHRRSGK